MHFPFWNLLRVHFVVCYLQAKIAFNLTLLVIVIGIDIRRTAISLVARLERRAHTCMQKNISVCKVLQSIHLEAKDLKFERSWCRRNDQRRVNCGTRMGPRAFRKSLGKFIRLVQPDSEVDSAGTSVRISSLHQILESPRVNTSFLKRSIATWSFLNGRNHLRVSLATPNVNTCAAR